MQKKKIAFIIVATLVISLLFAANHFAVRYLQSDEGIFKKRLFNFLATIAPPFGPFEPIEKARKELLDFSKQFSESVYADDAWFILIVYRADRFHRSEDVASLEEMIRKFPNGKIEEKTINYLRRCCRYKREEIILPGMYLPYDKTLLFIKGENCFYAERNYTEAIKYTTEFLRDIDKGESRIMKRIEQAYLNLFFSYKGLGKVEDAVKIKNEMIALFPEHKEKIKEFCILPNEEIEKK